MSEFTVRTASPASFSRARLDLLSLPNNNRSTPAFDVILFIERYIQRAVRGAVQHSKAELSVIINIEVNYF